VAVIGAMVVLALYRLLVGARVARVVRDREVVYASDLQPPAIQ
jgi:hypothetical protein